MKLFLPIIDNGGGAIRKEFLKSFLNSFSGQRIHADFISDSHPGRARNRAAANFLASDCDAMLFIDTDIVFNEHHIDMLMETDEDIVGGIYCLKTPEMRPCLQTLPGFQPDHVQRYVAVARTGTGFLRISRGALEKLKASVPVYHNHGRPEWDFFQSGVESDEWLSEDWYFCDLARKAGFSILIDQRIQLGHIGNISYPLNANRRLELCPDAMVPHIEALWCGEYDIPEMPVPKTILDIGANIGGFTMWASEKWPDAEIYAYEPDPDNAALWRFNCRAIPKAKLSEVAVTDNANYCYSIERGENCGEHRVVLKEMQGRIVPTHARNLPRAEFIKIDTEGWEVQILRNLDLTNTRAVALEYHSRHDWESITAFLGGIGFTCAEWREITPERGVLKYRRK